MSVDTQELIEGLQHPVIQEHLGEIVMQVTALLLNDNLNEVDKVILNSRLLIFEKLGEAEVSDAVKDLRDVIEILLAETPEGVKMTKAYFEKYGKEDYETALLANKGSLHAKPALEFTAKSGMSLRPLAYHRRLGRQFGLEKSSESLAKWKEIAGVVVYEKMTQDYFIKNAKADYAACKQANDGSVAANAPNKFKAANGEMVTAGAYLHRLSYIVGTKVITGMPQKWRELAEKKIIKYPEMDLAYFKANGKADYESCMITHSGAFNYSRGKPFLTNNGETIRPAVYLSRLQKSLSKKTKVGVFNEWKKLAGIVETKFPNMDEVYFQKNAKADYEACQKVNNGVVSAVRRVVFKAKNGETMLAYKYANRIKKKFETDPRYLGLGYFEIWRKVADIEFYEKMDRSYFEKHAAADLEACKLANDGRTSGKDEHIFVAANGETLSAKLYLRRLNRSFGMNGNAGAPKRWKGLAEGKIKPGGIKTAKQAKSLLAQEIRLMRRDNQDFEITEAEWSEILKPEHYKNNIVVQEAIDFLSNQSNVT